MRGSVVFGFVGDNIDQIATNYECMHWWISKKGLNMSIVPPATAQLSPFDRFAGKLYVARSRDGRLSKKTLDVIAKKIDAAGFTLRKELQRAQWKPIAKHNRENTRKPILSFEVACRYPVFVRSL